MNECRAQGVSGCPGHEHPDPSGPHGALVAHYRQLAADYTRRADRVEAIGASRPSPKGDRGRAADYTRRAERLDHEPGTCRLCAGSPAQGRTVDGRRP